MKPLKSYIIESDNHALYDTMLQLMNDGDIYRNQYSPLVNNLVKRHQKGDFDIERLETSSVVDKLAAAALKLSGYRISSADRKQLRKHIVAELLATLNDEGEVLTPEEEDYMVQWNYGNLDW